MLLNNLKIAWRHLLKNKLASGINLLGLIIGMTTAFFIWQYVHYEKSYDDFHEKGDRIFRIRTDRISNGVPFMQFAGGAAFCAPLLKNNFEEVEDYVKLMGSSEAIYTYKGDQSVRDNKVYYAMPSLFDVFSFQLLRGDPKTSLERPFTACISESTAQKLFGNEDPIGKTITRNNTDRYEITGIFEDSPSNSHIKFNILLSYITFSDVFNEGGTTETAPFWDGYFSYVLLKPNTDWKALEAKIPDVIERNYDEDVRNSVALYLQPLKDIHLTSNYLIEAEVNGDKTVVAFLFIIGISVLLIAWFNYINLSTANSELRAKEVGVRKVVGGSRKSLISQFILEAALLNLFAIIISLILVRLFHSSFEVLIDKSLPLSIFSNGYLLGAIALVLLFGTFLSGLYPAFVLSSFKPITALKTGFTNTGLAGNNWMRKSLVTIQFIASVGLIASTLIIYQQLNYLQNTKLGLNIDQTLIVKGPRAVDSTFADKSRVFKQEVEQVAMVDQLSGSTSIPGQAFGWTAGGVQRVGAPEDESESFHVMAADVNYSSMYEMELAAGRHMTETMGSDATVACMLNETGAKLLKFASAEEAVGKRIQFWGEQFIVVGVLKDFYQESPKAVVEPLVLRAKPANWSSNFYSIKMNTRDLSQSLASIEKSWMGIFPADPFEHFFLDDHFDKQYESDQRFGRVFTMFSGLAIFVSCLGLFALVTFVTEQKKKEIGIRKILGASAGNIIQLLSRHFIWLVVVALFIAAPLTWYFMEGWLEGFSKRINIQWWTFVLAGIMAISIAFVTIGFQGLRAIVADPVKSLRNE